MKEFHIPIKKTEDEDDPAKEMVIRGQHLAWGMRRKGYKGEHGIYVDIYHDIERDRIFYAWHERIGGIDGELIKAGFRSYKSLENMAARLQVNSITTFICDKLGVTHHMRDQIVEDVGDD